MACFLAKNSSIWRLIQRIAVVAVTSVSMPTIAQAQTSVADSCGNEDRIERLAERILLERVQVSGFGVRDFGGTAAYLLLRYKAPGFVQGMDFLNSLPAEGRQQVRRLAELRLNYAISFLGAEEGLRVNGGEPLAEFMAHLPEVARQILLSDPEAFFDLLTRAKAHETFAPQLETTYLGGVFVIYRLLDLDDVQLANLSEIADRHGEFAFAAMLLAARSDLSAYHEYRDRVGADNIGEYATPRWIDRYLMTARHQTAPQPREGESPEDTARRTDMFVTLRAAYVQGAMAWLGIVMNMTGQEVKIAPAARRFLTEVEAGRITPEAELETAWLFLYRAVAQELGVQELQRAMSGFDISSKTTRHYAGNAQKTIDQMLALEALTPLLLGQGGVPDRPAMLSPDFDWDAQVSTARGIISGAPVSEETAIQSALEMLLIQGKTDGAIDLANQLKPQLRLAFYRDLMVRFDRQCAGFTDYPGGEMTMGGQLVYRF